MYQNYSLAHLNTFHLPVRSKWFKQFNDREQLIYFLSNELHHYPLKFILGGGSNVLFVNDFDGLTLHVNTKGSHVEFENDDHIHLRVMAGEDWDQLVEYTVDKGWGGLENLSLIPGRVGASPIQNIGAYGVEVKDTIQEVEYYHLDENRVYNLNAEQCRFEYRNSIFKNELKGKAVILSVLYRLDKKPKLHYDYDTLKKELNGVHHIDAKAVREAVIRVRRSRLPDPEEIGNAGSFFKNPVISAGRYHQLIKKYDQLPGYEVGERQIKVPAAFLIESCGWKGKRTGNVGVHKHQPLVLVNFGKGSGPELVQLANQIKESVKNEFDIDLEMEVNVISNDS